MSALCRCPGYFLGSDGMSPGRPTRCRRRYRVGRSAAVCPCAPAVEAARKHSVGENCGRPINFTDSKKPMMFSFTSSAFCNSEGGGFLRTLCGGLPLFEPYGYAVYDNGKRTADRQIQNGMLFDAYRGEANQRYGNGRGNTLTGFPAQRGMPKAHQM